MKPHNPGNPHAGEEQTHREPRPRIRSMSPIGAAKFIEIAVVHSVIKDADHKEHASRADSVTQHLETWRRSCLVPNVPLFINR